MKELTTMSNLTNEQIEYVKDHEERELGCEECKKPLRRKHVSLETEVHEVIK